MLYSKIVCAWLLNQCRHAPGGNRQPCTRACVGFGLSLTGLDLLSNVWVWLRQKSSRCEVV